MKTATVIIIFAMQIIFAENGSPAVTNRFMIIDQSDSVGMKIFNQSKHEKSEIIAKGRSLLLEKFLNNELNEVKEIKDYLKNIEKEYYSVFYDTEYWLILYWTNEYDELLNSVKTLKSQNDYKRWYLLNSSLELKLKEKSSLNAQNILNQIQNASIGTEARDFLQLNFKAIVSGTKGAFQDSLNILANDFLKTYPETEYKAYIKKNIIFEYIPSNWGFGSKFFSGYCILTGELNNSYTNYIPLGVAFDIYYKRFEFSMQAYFNSIKSKTKKDFSYSKGVYKKDEGMQTLIDEVSLGYNIIDYDSFKISPFFGIARTTIEPTEINEIEELKEISINALAYTTGLNLSVRIYDPFVEAKVKTSGGVFLRLRYEYVMPNLSRKYDISGGMHFITIGVSVFAKDSK
ncbi:MAG: hypothetical protein LBH25_14315 [Fibromonadaceae bacterium]|nr:hypothetical protein [Fibromonadaceae bacterium]